MFGQPRQIAPHHVRIHAELCLHELRAGGDLGGKASTSEMGDAIAAAI
jgi:hypothetical protein